MPLPYGDEPDRLRPQAGRQPRAVGQARRREAAQRRLDLSVAATASRLHQPAEETSREQRDRSAIQRLAGADLGDPPVAHQRDTVADL